ncbi:MAG: GNAT family N-acetyltransferase [Rhodospirillales bacterium]
MKTKAEAGGGLFELRPPETGQEWDRWHAIRERALWGQLKLAALGAPPYSRDGFKGRADPEHQLILVSGGAVFGALGLDPLDARVIEVRAVAVEPARQRRGYGAIMMALAERAAAAEGFSLAVVSAHPLAMLFYAQNGYRHEAAKPAAARAVLPVSPPPPVPGAVWMGKRLDLGVAQSPPTVFIQAA